MKADPSQADSPVRKAPAAEQTGFLCSPKPASFAEVRLVFIQAYGAIVDTVDSPIASNLPLLSCCLAWAPVTSYHRVPYSLTREKIMLCSPSSPNPLANVGHGVDRVK